MNNLILISNIVTKAFSEISTLLDGVVFGLGKFAFEAFYYMSNISLYNDVITEFSERVLALVGIVMIFVLAINLLNYIVDPDKVKDKKYGTSTFIKDIVIALVVISILPTIFSMLYSLQNQILTSNVLSNLILGGYSDSSTNIAVSDACANALDNERGQCYIENGANTMVANLYIAFVRPDSDFSALDCGTDRASEYQDYCDAYATVKQTGDIAPLADFATKEGYVYWPLISVVAGVVFFFYMISFCVNLAKRVGKMVVLQFLAPVPLVLEILPNKKGLRDNWVKTLVKTFLEVFVFVAFVYIVILLISMVPGVVVGLLDSFPNLGSKPAVTVVITALLIYGLLQFGKEAPQMVFDLIGIKSTGILKAAGIRGIKMAGSLATGFGVGATTMTRHFTRDYKDAMKDNFDATLQGRARWANMLKSNGKALGAGAWGAFKSMPSTGIGVARGMYTNRTGGFKNIRGVTASTINKHMAREGSLTNKIGEYGHDIAEGFKSGNNIAQSIGRAAGAAVEPLTSPVVDWATGGVSNTGRLSSMEEYLGLFKKIKINKSGDAIYSDLDKQKSRILAEQGVDVKQLETKLDYYRNNGGPQTLTDYLHSSQFRYDFNGANLSPNMKEQVINLDKSLKEREQFLKYDQETDIRKQLEATKALIKNNSDIAELAKNIKVKLVDDSGNILYERDANGNIKYDDKGRAIAQSVALMDFDFDNIKFDDKSKATQNQYLINVYDSLKGIESRAKDEKKKIEIEQAKQYTAKSGNNDKK